MLFKHYRLLAVDGSDLTLPYNPRENNVIADNHVSTLHLNALYDVCNKRFLDVVIQQALKEDEYGAACKLVDRISEKHPVILLADRGFENDNLFAHVEEHLQFLLLVQLSAVRLSHVVRMVLLFPMCDMPFVFPLSAF